MVIVDDIKYIAVLLTDDTKDMVGEMIWRFEPHLSFWSVLTRAKAVSRRGI